MVCVELKSSSDCNRGAPIKLHLTFRVAGLAGTYKLSFFKIHCIRKRVSAAAIDLTPIIKSPIKAGVFLRIQNGKESVP